MILPMFKFFNVFYASLLSSLVILSGCSAADTRPVQATSQVVYVSQESDSSQLKITHIKTGGNAIVDVQQVKQAIKGSKFEVEQRGDAVVIIMPVKSSFNAKREGVLLPSSLSPLTKLAKMVKQDSSIAVLIIGHTDSSLNQYVGQDISVQRAKSVNSIFNVAGLRSSQVFSTGMGADQPRATNKTAKGREQNKRVEIIVVKRMNRALASLPNQYAVSNFSSN